MSKKKKQPQNVRVNFGKRTRYRPEKDDVPMFDRGPRSFAREPLGPIHPFDIDPTDPSYEDDLLADDPDIGDR